MRFDNGHSPRAAPTSLEPSVPSPPLTADDNGRRSVISNRGSLLRRLVSWQRRTCLNPYWLDSRHLDASIARLAPFASGTLFDVGVGERPYESVFAPHVSRYFGLEYPPVVFGNLNPELEHDSSPVRGLIDIWADGQCLPLADACVDTVLSLEVLEHLPKPEHCVAEMARVLRPGGRLLLTVPFLQPLHQLPFDFRRYTPRGLAELVEENGLEVEILEPRGNVATAAGATLSQWMLRHLAAKQRKHDGSIRMSRWRGPLVTPLIALTQLTFAGLERLVTDDALCLGWTLVARKR